MPELSRRNAIRWAGLGALGAAPLLRLPGAMALPSGSRQTGGTDLTGWSTVVGDAIYAAPGEAPVTQDDITTIHTGAYSELQANLLKRRIMAHNVTYLRRIDDRAFDFVHTFECQFMLPFAPSTANTDLNAQTIEGGLFIWDGCATRLDYGLAFQWGLNPWDRLGELRCWTDIGGGQWQPVGHLAPDLSWHTLRCVLDFHRQTTALLIDQQHYPCRFTATPKSAAWGAEIAAGIQVEIVSLHPGEQGSGALHKAYFRDWRWLWEPASSCRVFAPLIAG
jgi:hypothetical protein